TFESMDDFSPAEIARKVEPLRKLLETRTQLSNLLTYMDGKSGAEELLGKIMSDPTVLRSLVGAPNANASPATPPTTPPTTPPATPPTTPPTPDGDLDALLNDL
ncbi:MAG: type VI secretion system contractile sheath small subunit, partial [Pirellula sp.]